MKILIAGGGTGGHLMPALAIAQALRERRPDIEPVLVGARRGVDASILAGRPFRYHLLPAEPFYRRQWWKNARWAFLAPGLYVKARALLAHERPAVVVGTGGYAAAPVLSAAARRHLPVVLQEQNAVPGLTTRWFARFARLIYLGFPEAASRLAPGPHTGVHVVGNPVAPPPAGLDRRDARERLGLAPDAPVAFVFGGSQGSRALNRVAAGVLDADLLHGVTLCWGTGAAEWERYRGYHRPPRVLVRAFWDPIAEPYRACDVAVARAGAMTTAELCAYGLPAVLVPLPGAAADHQTRNAEALAAIGAAHHLPESDLTPDRLAAAVRSVLERPEARVRMSRAAQSRAAPEASRRIAEGIIGLLS